jgi:Tol biopolymer transport system component
VKNKKVFARQVLEGILILALGIFLVIAFQSISRGTPSAPATQAPAGPGTPYPPVPTPFVPDTPTPNPWPGVYPPPWPTAAPLPTYTPTVIINEEPTFLVPTPLPTPVVTPVPLAPAPILPGLAGASPQPFTLVYRDGNVLYAFRPGDQRLSPLVDLNQRTGLDLFKLASWGAASPDRRSLALVLCTSVPEGQKGVPIQCDIYRYDLESGDLSLLVKNGVEPVWSPDGDRLAYGGPDGGLWLQDLTTQQSKELFPVEADKSFIADFFAWSPDGKRIALAKAYNTLNSGAIWVVSPDGSQPPRQYTDMEEFPAAFFSWSPDSKQLTFVSEVGKRITPGGQGNLWLLDVETGETRQLTENMTINETPQWAPDGIWILVSATNALEGPNPTSDLWIVSRDGKEIRRLTADSVSDLAPIWDGSQVVYVADYADLRTLDLNTGKVSTLLSGADLMSPKNILYVK